MTTARMPGRAAYRITAQREPRSERHFSLAAVSPWNDTARPIERMCCDGLCIEAPGCPALEGEHGARITPYDVEAKRPGLTLLVAAVLIVGTVVLSVVFA